MKSQLIQSLYFIKDPKMFPDHSFTFGLQPSALSEKDYALMKRRIGLKKDLGWRENEELRQVIRKGDIWSDFPAKNYTLVGVEFEPGDEKQRIDILYIRDDGGILPCELKIGGTSLDTHGQLIRYIADLSYQDVDLDWVIKANETFLNRFGCTGTQLSWRDQFNRFLETNDIKNKKVRILPKSGIIMDEDFKPQLVKAVRYLNECCGFWIRLIQIKAFVADDWNRNMGKYGFRMDFTDVHGICWKQDHGNDKRDTFN